MKLAPPKPPRARETTIPLINVVFLMLVFFLVAGTIAPPLPPALELADTSQALQAPPLEALYIDAKGTLNWQGAPTTPQAFAALHLTRDDNQPVRLGADRALPADMLIDMLGTLRALGLNDIVLVTERRSQ